jgi:hypothetical protein
MRHPGELMTDIPGSHRASRSRPQLLALDRPKQKRTRRRREWRLDRNAAAQGIAAVGCPAAAPGRTGVPAAAMAGEPGAGGDAGALAACAARRCRVPWLSHQSSDRETPALLLLARCTWRVAGVRGVCFCLEATAMVLDLHPIGSSRAPSSAYTRDATRPAEVALPWVVAKRAPGRHRLRTPAFTRERGAECGQRIPIRTDRLR